ncbi:TetR family transcriptional regulator [Allokutzneria oryzae]|uniref:TetR family transcriptional regulator n=1 Tax=Allokutzneria oryzae TaxID=1378989 RepID=A0ABV5ZXG9_9PSEU
MTESRRERKKQQTRRLLTETAIRLFAEQGYEQTTVAQIAEAADVATKTFFNYFPSKEDVLFADNGPSSAVPLEVIASRGPGESVADLLLRAYEAMRADYLSLDTGLRDPALMRIYARLLLSVPALQARALHMTFKVQREMAAALLKVYPDELDPVGAAAVVGALAGGAQQAALTSMELGEPEERFWASVRRGVEIALRGHPQTRQTPSVATSAADDRHGR